MCLTGRRSGRDSSSTTSKPTTCEGGNGSVWVGGCEREKERGLDVDVDVIVVLAMLVISYSDQPHMLLGDTQHTTKQTLHHTSTKHTHHTHPLYIHHTHTPYTHTIFRNRCSCGCVFGSSVTSNRGLNMLSSNCAKSSTIPCSLYTLYNRGICVWGVGGA